jgi:predicted PurR-regulated permease PerM
VTSRGGYRQRVTRRLRRAKADRSTALAQVTTPASARAAAPHTPAARGTAPDAIAVPYVLRFMAAWSWRLLLVVAALYVFLELFSRLSVVLVPVIIGLLLAAVASPLVDRLGRFGLPRAVATAIVVLTGIVAIVALVALVAQQFSSGFGDLRSSFEDSTVKLENYLSDAGLSRTALTDFFDRVREGVSSGDSNLGGTVVKTATTAGHLLAGLFITLFATIFFTYDGRGIWRWIVGLFPERAQERVQGSGERAWAVLTSYVRATVIIAAVDAIGIVTVAAILGLPFLVPIGVLVFLGAFIPIVGASISGIAAVAVALVSEGPVSAIIMLGGVIAVQQLEGHVLQPFLLGRLVRVHPLAVVVVIAIGGLVAGIFGALIAVPLTAIINAVASYLASGRAASPEQDALDQQDAGAAADPAVAP